MSALKYILPAMAAAGFATAQNSCSGTATIANAGDAQALAGCQTYSGSVAVSSDAPSMLSFDGSLKSITGDLTILNATNVNSISASGLQTIGGVFRMHSLTTLSSLEMPQLTVANIDWVTLPALQGLTFGSFQNATSVNIQDTQLQKLDQLNVLTADTINIANNPILTSINWQITNCTTSFKINSNNANGGLNASFASLQGVGDMSVSNVSALMLNSLSNVNGTLTVAGSQIESLALPNLTDTKGLAVNNNPSLKNFTANVLMNNNGAFNIMNNDKLGGVLSFPQLQRIIGAVNVTGAFSGLDMPKINLIKGGSVVHSSQPLGDTCSTWGPQGSLKKSGVISAKPVCTSTANSGGSSGGSGGSGSDTSSSSSTSSNPAVALDPAVYTYTGLFGLLAALFGMM